MNTDFFITSMIADYCWVKEITNVNAGKSHIINHELHFHISWRSNEVETGKFMTLEEISVIVKAIEEFFGKESTAYLAWKNTYNTCFQIQNKGRV